MTKLLKLSLLSLFIVPALAGCGDNGNSKAKEEAKIAFSQIDPSYSSFASSDGLGLAGAGLVMSYKTENGYEFNFKYSVAPMQGKTYASEYVKINTNVNTLEVEIPTFQELNSDGSKTVNYAAYVLTAEALYKEKTVDTRTWNIRVNAEENKPQVQTIADAKATRQENDTVVTYGYVYGYYSYDVNHFYTGVYIANGADGLLLYAGKLTNYFNLIEIGDLVMVIGKAAPYNGLFEVKPDSIKTINHDVDGVAKPIVTELTGLQYKALSSTSAGNLVKMENLTMVSDLSNKTDFPKGAHWTLTAKDSEDREITIYVNYHVKNAVMEEIRTLFTSNPGKTFNFTGALGWYSGAQLTPIVFEKDKTAAMSFEINA